MSSIHDLKLYNYVENYILSVVYAGTLNEASTSFCQYDRLHTAGYRFAAANITCETARIQ